MTNYYWIIAQHSGKVIEVEGGSINNCAKIIQYGKKSADDPSVDTQLWFFNGGLITNKKSGLVLDVLQAKIQNGSQIVQFENNYEPAAHREWDYNHENNTITLRSNRNFVLDVKEAKKDDMVPIILQNRNNGQHQKFTLQKWNDTSGVENVGRLVTNIMADNKFLPKLSQNLLEILNDDEYYDVTIEVGNDPYAKIFRAHIVILNYRSSYLRGILSSNKKKNDGTLTHIRLPNILPKTFEIILRYIYGGKLSLKECDTSDIIKLLISAKELNLQELVIHIQSFLVENRVNWMEQNIDLIYQTSFENENDSYLCLQKYCNDLISQDPVKILKSQNFESISEKLLVSIIQKDNIQMREIEIWEHVLKWGLAKNPELPSDPTNYSKEDFNSLKNNLKKFIPYIRFHNLTSKEFLSRVFPYKKVLPKELYVDLLKEFLDNDNKTSSKSNPRIVKEINSKNLDSKIITFKHAETILKWIRRVEINDELPNSFEFKLLFRGSRDGFYPEKFHEICDNQSYTVTVAKVEGRNEILGGFNSIAWKSNNIYGASGDNFIFSFNNINRNENYILSRIMDKKHATNNKYYCGPSFGNGDLIICGFDLQTLCNYSYNSKNSYEKLIRETEGAFSVEDYEVFRVMFKFKGQ